MSKYDALGKYLNDSGLEKVRMSIEEIKNLITDPSDSITLDSTWFGNSKSHVQARSWMNAGWKADASERVDGFITFHKI